MSTSITQAVTQQTPHRTEILDACKENQKLLPGALKEAFLVTDVCVPMGAPTKLAL